MTTETMPGTPSETSIPCPAPVESHNGMSVSISESAAAQISKFLNEKGNEKLMFRVGVYPGGCSGYKYGLAYDDQAFEGDVVFEENGVKIIIDETSLQLLDGSTIDFVEDMMGASFRINNPRTASGCGCGGSFSM